MMKKCGVIIIVMLTLMLIGCDNSDVSDAYSIRDSKVTEAKKNESDSNGGNYYDIKDEGVAVSENSDTAIYNNFRLRVEYVKEIDTIFDLSELMSEEQYEEYKTFLMNRGINKDGMANSPNSRLFAIKCDIKNENDEEKSVVLGPDFYCLKPDGTFGLVSGGVIYGFSGVYEKTYIDGANVYNIHNFAAKEELETICVIDFDIRTAEENNVYSVFNSSVSVYMSATFFTRSHSTSVLPKGEYLIPIFIKGEPVK